MGSNRKLLEQPKFAFFSQTTTGGTMVEDFKKYLTVRDIAKKFGVTDEWIRDLIQAGKIRATKIGSWRVRPEDLEKFIKSRRNY